MTLLMLIWKDPITRKRYKVGELTVSHDEYSFKYVNPELTDAAQKGFKNYPTFPDLSKTYSQTGMFQTILERLPRKKRPDYLNILDRYNLNENSSDLEILIATRGRTPTDPFEFVQYIDFQPDQHFKLNFDLAGVRHYEPNIQKEGLVIGTEIRLIREPLNEWDPNAVKVQTQSDTILGYVPKYYSKVITSMLLHNASYSAKIVRLDFISNSPDEWIQAYVEVII
jgi:hypothetical protein